MDLVKTRLEDYKKLDLCIKEVKFTFEINDNDADPAKEHCLVTADYTMEKLGGEGDLILNGVKLELLEVLVNGMKNSAYEIISDSNGESLIFSQENLPETKKFSLRIKTKIYPHLNKTCEGLYKSNNTFCTQMEPLGMRRVTYFIDRPDNMAKYETTIIANKERYPVLLSNGNLMACGVDEKDVNKHWVRWEDPFLKPSYLFALVAGNLGMVQDSFTTMSGKVVDLRLYCDLGNEHKAPHALRSLKKAMKWDEERFGREYDLNIFMIVAVDAFNFGAMENKGLNIFNSSCVLADEKSSTDDEFNRIEAIVAHEYFHNWTGNRVTLRDWFQLTLKEGLTVFRDEEFSSDMHSRAIKRIQDVHYLYSIQFPEDASPNSHPIKPKEYFEINNFYTATIYHKGAEVIRMIYTLLGKDKFRLGMDNYFKRFDGKAICTENFLEVMEEAYGKSLKQFEQWYHEKGTPVIEYKASFDKKKKLMILKITQDKNLYMPITIGFVHANTTQDYSLILSEKEQTFTFPLLNYDSNSGKLPLVSFNRNFSACIKVKESLSFEDLCDLIAFDTNEYVRWNAHYSLSIQLIKMLNEKGKIPKKLEDLYLKTFYQVFSISDYSFRALLLSLPDESILADTIQPINFKKNHESRRKLLELLSKNFSKKLLHEYRSLRRIKKRSMAMREYMNALLSLLLKDEDNLCHHHFKKIALKQVLKDENMTNRYHALNILGQIKEPNEEFSRGLRFLYLKFRDDSQIMMKFFASCMSHPNTRILEGINLLENAPEYNEDIPNHVRSIWKTLANNNLVFHDPSGMGYEKLSNKIMQLDSKNPMLAAMLAGSFTKYPKMEKTQQKVMRKYIQKILDKKDLSKNVYEVLSKLLS